MDNDFFDEFMDNSTVKLLDIDVLLDQVDKGLYALAVLFRFGNGSIQRFLPPGELLLILFVKSDAVTMDFPLKKSYTFVPPSTAYEYVAIVSPSE